MLIAVTADLHWGHSSTGDAATCALAEHVRNQPPEAFAIVGDVGQGQRFGACLALFRDLPCPKLVVPGNHDLWTGAGDSHLLYHRVLPQIAAEHGFQYLDRTPFVGPSREEEILGSINWYDYSFADEALEQQIPDVLELYREKRFLQGRHNDGRFVRLGMTDEAFTGELVDRFQTQVAALPASVTRITVLQHHPPLRALLYAHPSNHPDGRIWLAYSGNERMEGAVLADERVRTVVCGHTHLAVEAECAGRRCYNVGGDYGWKRLLLLDTATGRAEPRAFGSA